MGSDQQRDPRGIAMIEAVVIPLTIATAIGSGLMGGFFFAFSVCVMGALRRLPPAQATTTMQSINVVVLNPIFFAAFFGTAAACLFLVVAAWSNWDTPGSHLIMAGSLLYLLGSIVVTIIRNVPLNEALKAVDANSAEGESMWNHYFAEWVPWNHVRTVTCIASAILLTVAACARI
jgi:uncharacterized membrane protein